MAAKGVFMEYYKERLQDGINIAKMVPAEYRTFVAIYMLTELIEDLHNRNSLDDERNGILVCIAEKLNAISASATVPYLFIVFHSILIVGIILVNL